jgi:clorobiocin biosynthesis protein Clo-hal
VTTEPYDVLVLGGGPAGSTFAGIVKKYAPDVRVVVLERARFPRWRVGESSIPVANGVLRDLGMFDRLAADPSVVKKIGVTFVWGADRAPWNADYLKLVTGDAPDHVIDVVGQDFGDLRERVKRSEEPFFGFNVNRAWFDTQMLDNAASLGAEVRQGTRAVRVNRDGGRVVGVDWEDDQGASGTIRADFVLDASGLGSLLTRGRRHKDPNLSNYAVHGYLRGAEWKVVYNGKKERTTVFIATVATGWIWYFPIGDDCMSVGAVTHRDRFKDRLRETDPESLFWEMLHDCPEVASMVRGATLRDDVMPDGARVKVSEDWSSWAEEVAGPGWAAAGDAAMFVDPILSSGVSLALQSGHRAACTYLTSRAHPGLSSSELWRAYADYLRGEYGAFLQMARFFYGNNKATESWFWEAHRLVNKSGRLDIEPGRSFAMATAGFFPFSKALSFEMMAPLMRGVSGAHADFGAVYHDTGVPADDELPSCGLSVVAPVRLALRTEPLTASARPGELLVYHDLVCDAPDWQHRAALYPTRIPPALAPVVVALHEHDTVAGWLDDAVRRLPSSPAADVRSGALAVLRIAALRGYVALSRPAA